MPSRLRRGRATWRTRSSAENAWGRTPFAARSALRCGGASALTTEFESLGQAQIHRNGPGATTVIARQDFLVRSRGGIEQPVARSDQSRLVRVIWNARSAVE